MTGVVDDGPVLVEVSCTPSDVELVSLALLENGAGAVEVLDSVPPRLRAGFPSRAGAELALRGTDLADRAIIVTGRPGEGERWRESWAGAEVGRHLDVRPPWSNRARSPGRTVIEIDPGRDVFGSGTHVSTTMALEELEVCVGEGDVAVDVGTGTGILAIAAVQLGAERAFALDIDAVAVHAARRNARRNGVGPRVNVARGGPECVRIRPDGIMCNLLLGDQLGVARALVDMGARWAVLTGILEYQTADVVTAWAPYEVRTARCRGGWSSLVFVRP